MIIITYITVKSEIYVIQKEVQEASRYQKKSSK
jgi:hypothetical protein